MKKLMALILALVMIPAAAIACETLIPMEEAGAAPVPMEENAASPFRFSGRSCWAVDRDTRELLSIKEPTEILQVHPVSAGTTYIRGVVIGGLIRVKGCAQVCETGGGYIGLCPMDNVSIEIFPEHMGLVAEIVDRRIGREPETAAEIAAATLWRAGDRVAHIFFRDGRPIIRVGTVHFNGGQDAAPLYAGLFDADDRPELGFTFGVNPSPAATKEPEATPEPEPEATPEPTAAPAPTAKPKPKPQATPKPACEPEPCEEKPCGKPAVKICWDIGVWFKGCLTLLTGCGK